MAGGIRPMAAWTCSATFWSSSAQLQGTKSSAKALGSWAVIGSSSSHLSSHVITSHKYTISQRQSRRCRRKSNSNISGQVPPWSPHLWHDEIINVNSDESNPEWCTLRRDIDIVVDTFGAGTNVEKYVVLQSVSMVAACCGKLSYIACDASDDFISEYLAMFNKYFVLILL